MLFLLANFIYDKLSGKNVTKDILKRFGRFGRNIIHKQIVNYLVKCGGAFHQGKYGADGRYVKLFTDEEYSAHQKLIIENANKMTMNKDSKGKVTTNIYGGIGSGIVYQLKEDEK